MAGILNLLGQGCYHFTTVAVTGKTWEAITIQEDSVITVLTAQDGTNLLTAYNLSGKTLKQGAYIPAPNVSNPIVAITMSSGSGIGYDNVG